MSGIIGHTTYALLAMKAARARRLPVAGLMERHLSSYLAGAYLGCDIQTLPAAICVESGEGVGYGSEKVEKSPITGGPVKPFRLAIGGREYSPKEIRDSFYGRSHLILGWSNDDLPLRVPNGRLADYAADVTGDTLELFGPGERPLAHVFGWLTHVVGDGLIKSVLDGIHLHLLDGKYTATNRPVQDLVSYHEIGIGELGLNWPALLEDLSTSPVEPVQCHYMRCSPRAGRLGAHFEDGWRPELRPLLELVLRKNRRYQRIRGRRLVRRMTLESSPDGERVCDPELSRIAGGLSYREMVEAAEKARFRHALWQMGELIADVFVRVTERVEFLQDMPGSIGPPWEELTRRWAR